MQAHALTARRELPNEIGRICHHPGIRFRVVRPRLPGPGGSLCYTIMQWPLPDPLALSSGAGARLALAGLVAGLLWAAVAWALAA